MSPLEQHNANTFEEFGVAAADFIQREVLAPSPNSEKDSKDVVDVINAISATESGRDILRYWVVAQETLEWGGNSGILHPLYLVDELWDGDRG